MGTVSFATAPARWAIGPITFDATDVIRLAEFFDDSIEQAGAFIREVWLPDATRTLQTLIRESGAAENSRLLFLCDHLREGAGSVGAAALEEAVGLLERALREGDRAKARTLAGVFIASICQLSLELAA